MRAAGSFGGAVFTHYSNLEPQRRREIEAAFSAAKAAICFTSSTLELGIDIGATETQVTRYLHDSYRSYEPLLDLGAFHHLLPAVLRRSAVVAAFDVSRFLAAVDRLRPVPAPEGLALGLERLVGDDA